MESQEYEDYHLILENNYKDFKEQVNNYLHLKYTLIGGFSFNPFSGTICYAQAVAKLKEQPCQNQLNLL